MYSIRRGDSDAVAVSAVHHYGERNVVSVGNVVSWLSGSGWPGAVPCAEAPSILRCEELARQKNSDQPGGRSRLGQRDFVRPLPDASLVHDRATSSNWQEGQRCLGEKYLGHG
jgi:hypothetical protein